MGVRKTLALIIAGTFLAASLPAFTKVSKSSAGFFRSSFPADKKGIQDTRLLYSQLLVFSRLGRHDKVISGCKLILEREHTFLKAYDLLVESAYEHDKNNQADDELGSAVQFFGNLLSSHPQNCFYWYGLGLANKYSGYHHEAVECFEKSISSGSYFWDVYEELIGCYTRKSQIEEAIETFSKTLADSPRNHLLYQALGYLYFWLDDYTLSLKNYQKALKFIKIRNNQAAEANCLYYLAYLYMYLNDYSQAKSTIRNSIAISKEKGLKFQEAKSQELLGFINIETGNYDQAFHLCRSALSMAQKISDKMLKNLCLRTLGVVHMERGNLARSQEYLKRCSGFYLDIGEFQKAGICLYWQAVLYQGLGNFSKALEYSKRGLDISQQLGFKTGQAFHLSTIGDIYFSLGDYDRALNYNLRALDISKKYIGKWSRVECFHTIGSVYMQLNQYQKALEYFEEALAYAQKIGHRREIPKCLNFAGMAHFRLKNYSDAYAFFSSSLEHTDKSGKKTIMGINYNCLGELCFRKNNYFSSEEYYSKALSIGEETGCPGILWEAYSGLGKISARKENFNQAVQYYKNSVQIIEDVRSHISVAEYSSGFFKSKISVYEELVDLLYKLHTLKPEEGYDKECFYFTEKAKARAFLDDLQEEKTDFSSLPSFAKNRREIQTLSRIISYTLTQLNSTKLSHEKRNNLWIELENAEEDLSSLWERIKKERPGYADALYTEPMQYEEIKNSLLDKKTGLAEYFIGEKNIFIFFISSSGLCIHKISGKERLNTLELVNNYVKILSSSRFSSPDCEIAGIRLYRKLLKPGNNGFNQQIKKLIIIPDRELYYLPFETLVSGNRKNRENGVLFLMNKFRISYAPSSTTLIHILKRRSKYKDRDELAAIGDPIYSKEDHLFHEAQSSDDIVYEYYMKKRFNIDPLRFASRELKSIAGFFRRDSVRVIRRKSASEEFIKKLPLHRFKIIHFATHSLLDEKNAGRSALVLSLDDDPLEDGFFQAREIYQIELDAELVVLSACQTARGKIEKGEGIQGLSRAFFCAGARSVLASLWNVDDRSSALFMKHYYRYLTKRKTKLESLRMAKIKMLESGYHEPYYWGAFILIGESDTEIPLKDH